MEVLNRKPTPDSWSALQVIYHLFSSEENILNYMAKKSQADLETLRNKSISSYIRMFLLNRAIKSNKKFKAPPVLEKIPDQLSIIEIEQKYATVRASMALFVNKIKLEKKENKEIFKHPRAGYFTIGQTMKFIEIHFDRHLAQIENAIKIAKK